MIDFAVFRDAGEEPHPFEKPAHRALGAAPTRAPAMAVSRLRHKLGPARSQLVTLVGLGFMLDSNPVKTAVDPRRER